MAKVTITLEDTDEVGSPVIMSVKLDGTFDRDHPTRAMLACQVMVDHPESLAYMEKHKTDPRKRKGN